MRCTLLLALLAFLTGCAVGIPLGEPGLDGATVLAQAEELRAAPTTRQAVHAALGEPMLAAPKGSAEVFHASSRQQQLALVMMFPMPGFSLRHEAWTLVAYDSGGAVTGAESAYRRQEFGDLGQGVMLRTGDYEFVHGQADLLLVGLDRYLADRPEGGSRCTVLVGCVQAGCTRDPYDPWRCGVCWNRLQVDDEPLRELPFPQLLMWRLADASSSADDVQAGRAHCEDLGGQFSAGSGPMCSLWRYARAPLQLEPGRHRLVATAKSLDGEARGEFECQAGQVVHAALYGEVAERYSLSRQLGEGLRTGAATGRIEFTADPPPGLQGQPVVLGW